MVQQKIKKINIYINIFKVELNFINVLRCADPKEQPDHLDDYSGYREPRV